MQALLAPGLHHASQLENFADADRVAFRAQRNRKDERDGDCESLYVVEHRVDNAHVLLQLASGSMSHSTKHNNGTSERVERE